MAGTAVKVIEKPDASALGEMVNAELANQIATAKKFPRDEGAALEQLEALATRSDMIAELCMYTLKRTQKGKDGGKDEIVFITGPSIRFMELLAYCWGNMRVGARIIEEGEKTITAQGIAYDLQRNNGLMVEIKRGITTSKGYRFSQDMINVTSNAACAIAERNAIEDCIPRVLWWDVYEAVKQRAIGAAQIPEKLQQAVRFFVQKGAQETDILQALGVKAVTDMGREHLEIFYGLRTALKEGTIDAAKIFTAEGAEQRERLTLIASEDPADPNVPGTPIDGLLNKAAPAEKSTEKKGGASKKAAPKASGDGGLPAAGKSGASDGKDDSPPAGEAGSPATTAARQGDKADGGSATQQPGGAELSKASGSAAEEDGAGAADADREDLDLVAQVEAAWKAAKPNAKSQPIREARGALTRISELSGSDDARKRATQLLGLYELD